MPDLPIMLRKSVVDRNFISFCDLADLSVDDFDGFGGVESGGFQGGAEMVVDEVFKPATATWGEEVDFDRVFWVLEEGELERVVVKEAGDVLADEGCWIDRGGEVADVGGTWA